jgi:hypothetical protein
MDTEISLAQAIRHLRSQLEEAAKEGKNADLRFVPKAVEVELSISFAVESEAGGGVKIFSLVDLSGKAKGSDASTHRVKLTLEPVGRDGNLPSSGTVSVTTTRWSDRALPTRRSL